MYGLYDKDGILRFVNSDKKACLDYAALFELNATNFCLMNLKEANYIENNFNLDPNQAKSNN
tara:strand:+ start:592 stop:777 length:186 start_codon:yes stop_codon:yes gene_type:complete